MSSEDETVKDHAARSWRLVLVLALLVVIAAAITTKLVSLYWGDQQAFLQKQGEARTLRTTLTPALRGQISDRNGEPLAVSAPVATIWANPSKADLAHPQLKRLAALLDMPRAELLQKLRESRNRQFIYLKRKVSPELAEQIQALDIPAVHTDRAYKRYYPAGEVTAHLVGFTNVDGDGQEGLELAYDEALSGHPGRKLVMKDRVGRTIKHIRSLEAADPGQAIELSIDLRLQYLAYRELKAAVQSHKADSGSAVVLDAHTGEVLAMVSQPSYNPNDRSTLPPEALRNRAIIDTFEPGSPMKPLTIASALMSGQYQADSVVDTNPGYMRIKSYTIRDHRNYGDLDLTGIITKSSNVGASKLALSMHYDAVRNLLENVGLGQALGTGFPGEVAGRLPYVSENQVVERAAMSYGYGLAVTPLQLAQAYLPFANGGLKPSVSLLKRDQLPHAQRVMPASVARAVLEMMETVTGVYGTGRRARITGYRVAGKTGTVHKSKGGGYAEDQYFSVFAGIAPVAHPRLVTVVMIDNPKGQEYYGGEVAAPVFSRIVGGALRLLNVAPDDWPQLQQAKANH